MLCRRRPYVYASQAKKKIPPLLGCVYWTLVVYRVMVWVRPGGGPTTIKAEPPTRQFGLDITKHVSVLGVLGVLAYRQRQAGWIKLHVATSLTGTCEIEKNY